MRELFFEPDELPAKELLEDFRKLLKLEATALEKAHDIVEIRSKTLGQNPKDVRKEVKEALRTWKGDRDVLDDVVRLTQYVLRRTTDRSVSTQQALEEIAGLLEPDSVPPEVFEYFRSLEESASRIWVRERERFTNSVAAPAFLGASYSCQLRPAFGSDYDEELGEEQSYFRVCRWAPSVALEIVPELNGEKTTSSILLSVDELQTLSDILGRALKRMARVEEVAARLNEEEVDSP